MALIMPRNMLSRVLACAAQEVCARLMAQGAASVATITLLDKAARRTVDLQPDFMGFEVSTPLHQEEVTTSVPAPEAD